MSNNERSDQRTPILRPMANIGSPAPACSPWRQRGRCRSAAVEPDPRRPARPRPALDAAATPDPGRPRGDQRAHHRQRAGRAMSRRATQTPRPRPSTGPSTCSRSWATSATATRRRVARSSTSCPRPITATCSAARASRPGSSARTSPAAIVRPIERRFSFTADVGHLTITGLCAACAEAAKGNDRPAATHDH